MINLNKDVFIPYSTSYMEFVPQTPENNMEFSRQTSENNMEFGRQTQSPTKFDDYEAKAKDDVEKLFKTIEDILAGYMYSQMSYHCKMAINDQVETYINKLANIGTITPYFINLLEHSIEDDESLGIFKDQSYVIFYKNSSTVIFNYRYLIKRLKELIGYGGQF